MEKKQQTLKVYDVIGSDSAITREDGIAVYNKIDSLLSQGIKVILDFANIEIMITVFLNAAIGQLYSKYNSDQLNEMLDITNIDSSNKEHFRQVIETAKIFFSKSPEKQKQYEEEVSKIIDNE